MLRALLFCSLLFTLYSLYYPRPLLSASHTCSLCFFQLKGFEGIVRTSREIETKVQESYTLETTFAGLEKAEASASTKVCYFLTYDQCAHQSRFQAASTPGRLDPHKGETSVYQTRTNCDPQPTSLPLCCISTVATFYRRTLCGGTASLLQIVPRSRFLCRRI